MRSTFAALPAASLMAVLFASTAAVAQTAPQPPRQQRPNEVVVTGSRPQVIDQPDRLSFNVASDLAAQTGTVAEALRNVPGVEVDLQGQVSLRGDTGVTILIDGRPSAMLKGDNRGEVLLSMPANQIERVEVITNPSAAFSPEGSGGVLNLITRKSRQAGTSGTVRANVGGKDRGSLSLNLTRSGPGLTLNGDAGIRRFRNRIDVEQTRERPDPLMGETLISGQDSRYRNLVTAGNAKVGVEHDLDKKNRITAEVGYREIKATSDRTETYSGNLVDPGFGRQSDQRMGQRNVNLQTSWRHTLPGKDHSLVAEAEFERGRLRRRIEGESLFGDAPSEYEIIRNNGQLRQDRLKFDYKKPLGEGRSLNLGYEGQLGDAEFRFSGARGTALDDLVDVPGLTNDFDFRQVVHALFGTYQLSKGKWEFQPGIRLEQANLDLDQRTDGTEYEQDYFRVYPTLHVGRALSERLKLRGSYSRRIQRPSPLDLNPFTFYVDPRNIRRGNPELKPETTDAFELSLQSRSKAGTFLSLTGFHRRSKDGFTDIVQPLPGGVLLTTRANLGRNERTGVDAILTGKLSKTLSYNLSGTVQHVRLDSDGLGGIDERSGTVASGRGNVTWQPTPRDYFQLSGNVFGRQLLPQGYRVAGSMLNLGYRRKIDEKLSLVFTGQNILNSARQEIVIRTPTVRDRLVQKLRGRMLMLGFAYNFGGSSGKKKPEAGFEFDPSATSVGG